MYTILGDECYIGSSGCDVPRKDGNKKNEDTFVWRALL